MEGFIATALVLVERGGGNVPSLGREVGPDARDVSVSDLRARADLGKLIEFSTVHSGAMPA